MDTADEHVDAIRETLDGLGLAEPFALVGYSLGGDIALRYGARYGDEVRRLFLLSTPFYLAPSLFSKTNFAGDFLYQIMVRRFLQETPPIQPR